MRRKLIGVLLVLGMLISLSACKFDKANDKDLIESGYSVIVTFDANGGKIGNYNDRKIYCKENSFIFPPGTNNLPKAVNDGVILDGWYRGEKNADGTVTYGEVFDFNTERVTSSMTLYAKWVNYYITTIHYGENSTELKSTDATQVLDKPSNITWTRHTLLGYFEDEACTIPFAWDKAPTYNAENKADIYTKWLDGTYVLVSDKSSLKTIKANTNLYFLNDVNMEGNKITFPSNYTGTIIGNGYTLSNFVVNWTQSGTTDVSFGMFKTTENANISDITFDNVTVNVSIGVGQNHKVGLLIGSAKNTTVTNTVIKNSTLNLTIESSSIVVNATKTYGFADTASTIDLKEENNTITQK